MKSRYFIATLLSTMLLYTLSLGPVVAYQAVRTRKYPSDLVNTYYRPLVWLAPLGTPQNNALSYYIGFWASIFVRTTSAPQIVPQPENSN
jgi:hypothetical protein